MFCRGGDRIRTCASVKEPPCPHGREHHLDLLVVRRLNYACAVSGFCIFNYHSERSSTPPLIGTSLRHGWNFARLPSRLARDFSLLPILLPVPLPLGGGRITA